MTWILFAILTALLWGIGQIVLKKGLSTISPLWNIVLGTVINFVLYISIFFLNGDKFHFTPILLVIIPITLLYIFFYYAIEKGQLILTGTLFATYPITTIILSRIFLKEIPSLFQYFMIFTIILGAFLLNYFSSENTKKLKINKSWLAWAIFGSITTGAADFLAKVTISNTDIHSYNLAYPFGYMISLIIFWLLDTKGRKINITQNKKGFTYTLIGITIMNAGIITLNFALSKGPASIVSSVSSGYIAISAVLAYFFLHEKINPKQLLAVILILFGIIFLSL